VIYTAFLLGQAEGRDLWQNNLLPFQLFVQSMMAASGVFFVLNFFINFPADLTSLLTVLFPASVAVNLLLTFAGKLNSFPTDTALRASSEMTRGRFRIHCWWGGIALGHILPLALILAFAPALRIAVIATLIGLFFYEYAFVMAPQYIPNS